VTRARLALSLLLFALLIVSAPASAAARNGPDLASGSLKGKPKALAPGTRFTVKVRVRNAGNRRAGKSTLDLYLGLKARHRGKDLRIGRSRVGVIRPHKSKVVKIKAKLPAIAARTLKPGSYRLIACVDALHKVKERNERNDCRAAGGTLKLRAGGQTGTGPGSAPAPGGSTPSPVGLPAFATTDGISFGREKNAAGATTGQDDPVPVTLTAANGFAGQAGYARAQVASQPVPAGTVTTLAFTNLDDGSTQVNLPFTFSFGGIPYASASVSTNGYVSFGDAAWDEFTNATVYDDFRGVDAVAGNFYRGLMPYWSDLTLAPSDVTDPAVSEIVAPGNASVTFQWHVPDCCGGSTAAERNIAVTLFPDGSFRYDYGSPNPDGTNDGFVGYSAGNGMFDDFVSKTSHVPTTGLLYTPKALPQAAALAAGTITGSIPRGTSASDLDPGCTVSTAATDTADGLVTCSVPALGPGQSAVRHYSWSNSLDEMAGEPPTRDYSGSYTPGGTAGVADTDEFAVEHPFETNSPTQADVAYVGPVSPTVGNPITFSVVPKIGLGGSALFNPAVQISIPANTTLDSVEVDGLGHAYAGCQPPSAGTVSCRLPFGDDWFKLDVTLTPATPGTVDLTAHLDADNAGTQTIGEAPSPSVAP